MKETPILFSEAMVRAILDGRKTVTRRIIKNQPSNPVGPNHDGLWSDTKGSVTRYFGLYPVGTKIWVRESYYHFGHWAPVLGVKTKGGKQKWEFRADMESIRFDAPESFLKGRHHKDPSTPAWHKRLGRFMPKAFSRITLEVTGVRVERLGDINEKDALAEGAAIDKGHSYICAANAQWAFSTAVGCFEALWESIHGCESWRQNPWVWVVEFKRIKP